MIDLNCDVGEGLHNEHLIMPFISSCNIACGGHAGSVEIMDHVIALAIQHDVKIGVHPSFEDKENFGRVVLDISNKELQQSLVDQMKLFKDRAKRQEANIHHVKPHGALYNLIAINKEKAEVVVNAIQQVFDHVKMYVPFNSVIEKVAGSAGIEIIYEAFADRNYNDDLTLVSRKESNAILTDPDKIIEHVSRMANESKVKTITGIEKNIKAQTFCIHGDNENVIAILEALQDRFIQS
jgi:UPF0271 protein